MVLLLCHVRQVQLDAGKRHIDGTAPPTDPPRPPWEQNYCCACSRIYSSISEAVLDFTMGGDDQTARDLWVAISNHFQSNKAPRAIFLSHAFHTMTQGDLSISDYGQEMKKDADAIRDVGEPVSESTMVLNLLCGLNPRFINTADYIAGMKLDFTGALDQLAIKELRLANADKVAASTALIASSTSSCSSSTCRPSTSTTVPLQQPSNSCIVVYD